MKSILMSIRPEWCKKIFDGEKTIEVRKTAPKLETPFKVLVYETKGKTKYWSQPLPIPYTEGRGKVIGSFICDKITRYESEFWDDDTYERIQEPWELLDFAEYGEYEYDTIGINGEFYGAGVELSKQLCLSWKELRNYVGQGIRNFYGWHITAPKLYDKPRELGEFVKPCDWNYDCCTCKRAVYELTKAEAKLFYGCDREITRPPQSWCYVDELQ